VPGVPAGAGHPASNAATSKRVGANNKRDIAIAPFGESDEQFKDQIFRKNLVSAANNKVRFMVNRVGPA
jgi:hypothetical protein